jgi:hypothetical protein
MKDPRWEGKVYKALMPDGVPWHKKRSIWEERWSTAFLQNEREQAKLAGELDDWMFERQNEPVSALLKNLKGYKLYRGDFERWNDQNLLHLEGHLAPIPIFTYHAIDPAFSQAANADYRAQITFGMGFIPMSNFQKPAVFILEYDYDHKDPDTIIERALDLHKKYFYRNLIVETVAGQKIYEFLASKEMQQDPFLINHPLLTEFVNHQPRSKEDRIYLKFKSMIKLGQLFVHPEQKELQFELDNFLQSPHLHLLDALEMGLRYSIPCNDPLLNRVTGKPPRSRMAEKDELQERLEREGRGFLLY